MTFIGQNIGQKSIACFCLFLSSFLLPTSLMAGDYCNIDPLYELPDFSPSAYKSRCKKNSIARVKRANIHLYCDKEQILEVVNIIEKEQRIIFDCSYMDVEKSRRSKIYRWKDNEGNAQFTKLPPPRNCVTSGCINIQKEIAQESDLNDVIEAAIARYTDQEQREISREKQTELDKFPSTMDFLELQSTGILCLNLSLMSKDKNKSQLVLKIMDLYDLKETKSVAKAFVDELSTRLRSEFIDVGKIYMNPGSVWVGMNEALLNCSRPDPELIYDEATLFGSKKKQYIYELERDYEYVDIQNGLVTKVSKQPLQPDE